MTNAPICVSRVKCRLLRTQTRVYGIWGVLQGLDGSLQNLLHRGIQNVEERTVFVIGSTTHREGGGTVQNRASSLL
jgi:hypothetical protein